MAEILYRLGYQGSAGEALTNLTKKIHQSCLDQEIQDADLYNTWPSLQII